MDSLALSEAEIEVERADSLWLTAVELEMEVKVLVEAEIETVLAISVLREVRLDKLSRLVEACLETAVDKLVEETIDWFKLADSDIDNDAWLLDTEVEVEVIIESLMLFDSEFSEFDVESASLKLFEVEADSLKLIEVEAESD